MQWLIDIVYEKVMAAIGPHNPFVDAGDILDFHWRDGDLTADGTWQVLDLSSIIPIGTKFVPFHFSVVSPVIGAWFIFREYGNIRSYNVATIRTQVANGWNDVDFLVTPSADRKVAYIGQNVAFTHLYLSVKGWWI